MGQELIIIEMDKITVFCGSSMGTQPAYATAAYQLGQELAQQKMTLIYGGAQVGLMGQIADGTLSKGGKVIGVIPKFLETKEIAHQGLTELISVRNMHERKMKMNELCNGVIALPGGFGTFEELFEMLTWAQLGLHKKPIGLLNINGFYDDLIAMIDKMVSQGFLKAINQEMLIIDENIEALLIKMKNYQAPEVPKWIKADEV